MYQKKRNLIVVLAILSLASCERADEYGFREKDGYPLHLNHDYLPLQTYFIDTLPQIAIDPVARAVETINNTFGIVFFQELSHWDSYYEDIAFRKMLMIGGADTSYMNRLGITFLNMEKNHKGVVESVNIELSNSTELTEKDYYYLAVHELGHAIGLDDDDNQCSMMYRYYYIGFCSIEQRGFTQYDIDIVKKEYTQWQN